jgi:hypothetical protein
MKIRIALLVACASVLFLTPHSANSQTRAPVQSGGEMGGAPETKIKSSKTNPKKSAGSFTYKKIEYTTRRPKGGGKNR